MKQSSGRPVDTSDIAMLMEAKTCANREMYKGSRYTLPRKKIIECMKLSTEDKLTWLEEVVSFTIEYKNESTKRERDHFRNFKSPANK